MTSPDDAPPLKPPPSFSPSSPLPTKSRYSERLQTSQPTLGSLPESGLSHSSTPDLQSTTSSRASSPDRRLSRSSQHLSRSSNLSPTGSQVDGGDDIRSIIIRAFAPVIGTYACQDTEELVRRKGFKGGFHELIRPFGEQIAGKVIIRDGIGSSRSWDDYGVRFTQLNRANGNPAATSPDEATTPLAEIEKVLERYLEDSEREPDIWMNGGEAGPKSLPLSSSLYRLFLRRLLSSASPTPHETFAHPVACVIAISSHTPSPLETLRQLYVNTSHGTQKPPPWMHPEYLRYYVLVHDEDRDDITQSTSLFDQMKRHFGLHCHLLRLRSNRCVVTDDDSTQFPSCEWLSPREDLMRDQEPLIDVESEPPYIFESDITAIRSFVRELVAQSVIPHMENRVALWNEQVASRRRGLSGRFMSMSKRWTAFGSSPKSSGTFGYGSGSSGSNYDSTEGFYKPESPEAVLRKMADYSFMLRDWKLASSTYELLRSDFGNDKAWRYHAGAHEMCAISTLLNPLSPTFKFKLEPIDQLLDTACYSYFTRCSDAQNTVRTLVLGVELLKSRGGPSAEAAARWGMRVLDMGILGDIGRSLLYERIAACYASKIGIEGAKWGTRRRKAGMWSLLASDSWLRLKKPILASASLEEADRHYGQLLEDGIFAFHDVQEFVDELRHSIKVEYLERSQGGGGGANGEEEVIIPQEAIITEMEETREKLDNRNHRKSLIGAISGGPLETTTTSLPIRLTAEDGAKPANDDDFE